MQVKSVDLFSWEILSYEEKRDLIVNSVIPLSFYIENWSKLPFGLKRLSVIMQVVPEKVINLSTLFDTSFVKLIVSYQRYSTDFWARQWETLSRDIRYAVFDVQSLDFSFLVEHLSELVQLDIQILLEKYQFIDRLTLSQLPSYMTNPNTQISKEAIKRYEYLTSFLVTPNW